MTFEQLCDKYHAHKSARGQRAAAKAGTCPLGVRTEVIGKAASVYGQSASFIGEGGEEEEAADMSRDLSRELFECHTQRVVSGTLVDSCQIEPQEAQDTIAYDAASGAPSVDVDDDDRGDSDGEGIYLQQPNLHTY